MVAVPQRAV